MKEIDLKRLLMWSIASRVMVCSISWFSYFMIEPYDNSAQIQKANSSSWMEILAHPFTHWDGVYFVEISKHGYQYEQVHAFFPGLPILMRLMSSLVAPEFAGWIISNVAFVLATWVLYLLSERVLGNKILAYRTAILFCFSPSSVFLSAVYSESLSCLLAFGGLYCLEMHKARKIASTNVAKQSWWLYCSAILFGYGSLTRANNNLLSLYIAWHRLQDSPSLRDFMTFVYYWVVTALLGAIAVGPQLAYFIYGVAIYCPSWIQLRELLEIKNLVVVDRPWCTRVIPFVFSMYSFIQKEYWGVGPFAYYTIKQIPNFLLASPMIMISTHGIIKYFQYRYKQPTSQSMNALFASPELLPYILHWAFLLINGVIVAHIQIITRLLSSCPALYWCVAILSLPPKSTSGPSWYLVLIVEYFVIFNIAGAILFPTFYPWT